MSPAAGWYADPVDGKQLRMWDGAEWTEDTQSWPLNGSAAPWERGGSSAALEHGGDMSDAALFGGCGGAVLPAGVGRNPRFWRAYTPFLLGLVAVDVFVLVRVGALWSGLGLAVIVGLLGLGLRRPSIPLWVMWLGTAIVVAFVLPLSLTAGGPSVPRNVPNAVGLTPAAAETLIGAKGFVAVVVDQPTSTGGTGLVVAESPSPGLAVEAGSTVTITVSVGP